MTAAGQATDMEGATPMLTLDPQAVARDRALLRALIAELLARVDGHVDVDDMDRVLVLLRRFQRPAR